MTELYRQSGIDNILSCIELDLWFRFPYLINPTETCHNILFMIDDTFQSPQMIFCTVSSGTLESEKRQYFDKLFSLLFSQWFPSAF